MAKKTKRKSIILGPNDGRKYKMGRIESSFKADNEETGNSYSVSEWSLAPRTKGPGTHDHDDDHVFYIIEGEMNVLINKKWTALKKGSYAIIPGGTPHDFENRGSKRAKILSFNNKSGFENSMPHIVEWFAENPAEDVD